jgi:Fe(3+) dicitrate transport protein
MKLIGFLLSLLLTVQGLYAQNAGVDVKVTMEGNTSSNVEAFLDHTDLSFQADRNGLIQIRSIQKGNHILTIFAEGYQSKSIEVYANSQLPTPSYTVELIEVTYDLNEVEIVDANRSSLGMKHLKYIEVDGLYAAKKNEIVVTDEMAANTSTNNSRQIFSKVAGVNVQETDAGGLQMGIGVRGLDPKRTTNFNTRQDGYDISADALGYPESYYTPPLEAVEQIELVRGAASLQYGTQFGGLLNFKMKRGSADKVLEVISRQTVGSYNYLGSFNSIGGNAGEWNYYGYFQHKQGRGWRPNTDYISNGFYAQAGRKLGEKWSIDLAFTYNFYNTQQAGGLTDRQFEIDPNISFRDRNWFRVNWNVANVTLNGQLTKNLTINSKTFVLSSSRAALGFLGSITRIDTGGARDLILGEFNNIGNETRLVQRFNRNGNPGAIIIGSRIYQGNTRNRQGKAEGFDGPDYDFINPGNLEGSDFTFPSRNAALFTEALIPLSACWFLTPGARLEHIITQSEGYYTEQNRHPITGELLSQNSFDASTNRERNILLMGVGLVWRCRTNVEVYANASQNYRAMNFSDIYVNNPNIVIAPGMQDEKGFTIDVGAKGKLLKEIVSFDASLFVMQYRNRIGETLTTIENPEGIARIVNYRDNIADALFVGIELVEELDFTKWLFPNAAWQLTWFNNLAAVDARYQNAEFNAFNGNRVENVPVINYKSGINFRNGRFASGVQFSWIGDQFTDASNAEFFPDATVGVIPSYRVLDATVSYSWKRLKLEGSVNNIMDEIYFTRRATGYPGPGIIPAQRRMIFMTLQVKI